MAALTLKQLERVARDEVGAKPHSSIEMRELANLAGEHMMASRQWRWAEGREARLRPRAEIALTGATWTHATRTLTKVGAFAGYTFLSADTLEVTGGTGATVGTYEVESKTSADAIVLRTSIGAAADAQVDIAATAPNDQIALPGDFSLQQIMAYGIIGLSGWVDFVGAQEMLTLRSLGAVGNAVGFQALLRHVRGVSGGQPVPRLELYPRTTDETEALVIVYRGGWREPVTDEEVLSFPNWLNLLYLEFFKAVVMGTEEPEKGSVSDRLGAVQGGVLWATAARYDANMQTDFGFRSGTWLEESGARVGRYDTAARVVLP